MQKYQGAIVMPPASRSCSPAAEHSRLLPWQAGSTCTGSSKVVLPSQDHSCRRLQIASCHDAASWQPKYYLVFAGSMKHVRKVRQPHTTWHCPSADSHRSPPGHGRELHAIVGRPHLAREGVGLPPTWPKPRPLRQRPPLAYGAPPWAGPDWPRASRRG